MNINVSNFKCQNCVSFPALYKIEVHSTSDGTLDLIKYVIYMVAGSLSMMSLLYRLLLIVMLVQQSVALTKDFWGFLSPIFLEIFVIIQNLLLPQ